MGYYCESWRNPADFRWQAGLYNSTSLYRPTPETGLATLIPGLLGLLRDNMDLLDRTLTLLDSYLLQGHQGRCSLPSAR